MNKLSYEQTDLLVTYLAKARRSDLERFIPYAGNMLTEAHYDLWTVTLAQFERGDTLDAVTSIERWFEPRQPKKGDRMAVLGVGVSA